MRSICGDREDEVGRGRAGRQLAGELEADDLGDQHRHRLAEHDGLGLDAADAPAEHAEAVDHRGVRVGADQRVGVRDGVAARRVGAHDLREVLEVDLVADAGAGRHDLHVRERLLAPAQEQVALVVALVLELDVACLNASVGAVLVDLDRVIDHEIDRPERVDRVAGQAELDERVAHRGEVAHGRARR